MENPVAITIKSGSYEGEKGFMAQDSKVYNGKVLVMFPGRNIRGAYIKVEFISIDATEVESKEEVKTEISNPRFVMFFVSHNGSRNKHDFRDWVSDMIVKFFGKDCLGLPSVIPCHDLFDRLLMKEVSKI